MNELHFYQQRCAAQLSLVLDALPDSTLKEAMQYSTLNGGKRIRATLVYLFNQLFGGQLEKADAPACAVELIHAYSLVHDDLPALDDDDLRRGKATTHIQFDEAVAILAGDALQTLAFDVVAHAPFERPEQVVLMLRSLSRNSGGYGMCYGQMLDLQAENKTLELEDLQRIHQHKTGDLIRCAVEFGVYAAPSSALLHLPTCQRFAQHLGIAFQIQDDILDVTADTDTLGKPANSDLVLNKATYPALLGLDQAKKRLQQHTELALNELLQLPYNTAVLQALTHYLFHRKF